MSIRNRGEGKTENGRHVEKVIQFFSSFKISEIINFLLNSTPPSNTLKVK